MEPFTTNDELLGALQDAGHDYRELGRTPMGEPLVVAETGGTAEPTVFVTAGAHATEQAGVSATVELLDTLDTDHRVAVVPTRDPVGLNGYEWALGRALCRNVVLDSFDDLEATLRSEGDVVYDEDGLLLALVGDTGFASMLPGAESSQLSLMKRLKRMQHEEPEPIEPFRGRRLYLPAGQPDIEGSGTFNRAYTLVVSPDGQVLHLNRFFDAGWAPVESRCLREFMDDLQPGITFDLHETQLIEDRYFVVSYPTERTVDPGTADRIAREITGTVRDAGAEFATDDDVRRMSRITTSNPDEADESDLIDRIAPGAYRAGDPARRDEGLNATDLAARSYGLAYGTETGMWASFADRTDWLTATVHVGLSAFEVHRRNR